MHLEHTTTNLPCVWKDPPLQPGLQHASLSLPCPVELGTLSESEGGTPPIWYQRAATELPSIFCISLTLSSDDTVSDIVQRHKLMTKTLGHYSTVQPQIYETTEVDQITTKKCGHNTM